LNEFHKHKREKDGLQTRCKSCVNKHRAIHKESIKLSRANYHANNKERLNEISREYQRTHKETDAARKKEWSKNNKLRDNERKKQWAKTEVGRAYYASWQSGRRVKLATPLSELDWFVLLEAQRLSKLRENMLGTKWHVDHIIPVSLGGTNEYTNIQVVPAAWNLKKGNRNSDRFFDAVPRQQGA